MPRIEDYQQALGLVREGLSGKDPDEIASFSGAKLLQDSQENRFLSFHFLNQEIEVAWPDLGVSSKQAAGDMPIQQQVLLLHYLLGAVTGGGPRVTGEWIAFQDIPDGRFYLDAFLKRAKVPLVSAFGEQPEKLVAAAVKAYGATPFDHGDFSVLVKALPLIHVALILWKGDEEFPPEGNVLFDRNISRILSAEDIAWLAGMIIYPLVEMASRKGQNT